jgi:Tetracyclin repressor-like, C-terminal domain
VRRRLLEAARPLALETADPLFCDLLANLQRHLEHEVDLDMVVEIRRSSAAAVMSLADAIEQALPALERSGALNVLLAA